MRSLKLVNSTHPQTLMIATILLYVNALFAIVNVALYSGYSTALSLVGIVLPIAGAYGIANDKKWGYYVGVVAAAIPVVIIILFVVEFGLGVITGDFLQVILSLVPFVLLIHPQSRTYVNTWFTR
ncbi:hypothetical protein SAMN02745225_01511 [Ferrithrix thermotolerans DSM 19514]|jgi:uncharacterized membrane protein (DUF2068 family)|uniref:SPW repeat-containing protein n=1 Tax=Ferrithrix thermotolerans DSM 19514 TaxID=1121881 RepID=A0A1M4W1S4_9ACTN|nr:hypothetical protein [Ferrithrix thermotolerans]SHE75169.1 hypothetical protein SAMN02745225_01511 [Ferrithrix thermotolerans DSM 19514]